VPPGSGDVRVHYGGPIQERRGFVLHTPDWTGEGTTVVDGRFAVTEDPTVLQAMARGTGPRRALFFLGYAGWGPGQLEAELAAGAWGVAPADERLVFDEDPQQKWIEATTAGSSISRKDAFMKTIDIHAHLVPRSLWHAADAHRDWYGFRHEPGDGIGIVVGAASARPSPRPRCASRRKSG